MEHTLILIAVSLLTLAVIGGVVFGVVVELGGRKMPDRGQSHPSEKLCEDKELAKHLRKGDIKKYLGIDDAQVRKEQADEPTHQPKSGEPTKGTGEALETRLVGVAVRNGRTTLWQRFRVERREGGLTVSRVDADGHEAEAFRVTAGTMNQAVDAVLRSGVGAVSMLTPSVGLSWRDHAATPWSDRPMATKLRSNSRALVPVGEPTRHRALPDGGYMVQ